MYMETTELASVLGVSYRRLRQLIEQGYSKAAPNRGMCHAAWFLHCYAGLQIATDKHLKIPPQDAGFAVCISWLGGAFRQNAPKKADIDLLVGSFEREGFSRDDCLMNLGRAKQWWSRLSKGHVCCSQP